MFIDMPHELFTYFGIDILQLRLFIRVTVFLTPRVNMVFEVEPVDIEAKLTKQFCSYCSFSNFLISGVQHKVTCIVVDDELQTQVHLLRDCGQEVVEDTMDLQM